jgi:hypothetical protein
MPIDSVKSGAVVVDARTAEACIAALAAAREDCAAPPPHACDGLYVRQRKAGEACTAAYECAPGERSAGCLFDEPSATVGVCVESARGTNGDPCLGSCPGDTPCSFTTSGVSPSSTGATCFGADGLYCDGTLHVCKPFLSMWDYCDEQVACGPAAVCYYECYRGPTCFNLCESHPNGCGGGGPCELGTTCRAGSCQPAQTFAEALDCYASTTFSWYSRALGW